MKTFVHESLFSCFFFAACIKVGRAQLNNNNNDDDDAAEEKLCRISTLLTQNFFLLACSFPST